jgi:hypothetical protein
VGTARQRVEWGIGNRTSLVSGHFIFFRGGSAVFISGHLRFRPFFYGTMLSENGIALPKTPPALCRVFVLAVAQLWMLRMPPGAVLNIARFITALLEGVC